MEQLKSLSRLLIAFDAVAAANRGYMYAGLYGGMKDPDEARVNEVLETKSKRFKCGEDHVYKLL